MKLLPNIILFGTGMAGRRAFEALSSQYAIVGFCDNDRAMQGKQLFGLNVYAPNKLQSIDFEYVVVCSMYSMAIQTQLMCDINISHNRIRIASESRGGGLDLHFADPYINALSSDEMIPVFHIASMARSGETLLLHRLNNHPDTRISHNLNATDKEHETRFFQFMMNYAAQEVPRDHPLLKSYSPTRKTVMILKQAVWQHKWPFNGVILSRNPLAIYASVATYRDPVKEASCRSLPASRNAFLEWMQRIAPEEYPHFKLLKPADQFCNFYNLRMQHLLDNTKNPIVNYETLVCSPNRVLNQILSLAGLSKSDNIAAPSNCPSSPVGHGGFDPTMPIREESITKYLRTLSPTDIRYIWSRTKEVAEAYGYRCKGLEIISTNTSRTLG